MEDLAEYLEIRPQATADVLRFLRHLLEITETEEITRSMLMTEAQFFLGKFLSPDVRDFIAKRVFAFYRKNSMQILGKNLSYFPSSNEGIHSKSVLRLLEFTPWEESDIAFLQSQMFVYSDHIDKQIKSEHANTNQVNTNHANIEQIKSEHANIEQIKSEHANIEQIKSEHANIEQIKSEHANIEKTKQSENITFAEQAKTEQIKQGEDVIFAKETETKQRIPLEDIVLKLDFQEAPPLFLIPMTEKEDIQHTTSEKNIELSNHYDIINNIEISVIDIKKYEDWILPRLNDMAPWHLPRILRGIMDRHLHSMEQKYPLMRLKDNLIRYEKFLTTPISLNIFINYGTKTYQKTLDTYCELTNIEELNHIIRQYLEKAIELGIKDSIDTFRKTVEYCQTPIDLQRLLASYPMQDESMVNLYSGLKIVQQLKKIMQIFQENKEDLQKSMNQVFGQGEVNIKRCLQNILLKNKTQYQIYDNLSQVYDINSLFRYLQVMKKEPTMSKTADTIFQLIGTFLRGKQAVSYPMFKTGINFLYPGLQQKILFVIKKKIKQDMQKAMEKILQSSAPIKKRWKDWNDFLQNPQWSEAEIEIFQQPFPTFQQKFHIATQTKDPIASLKKSFPHASIPQQLFDLLHTWHQDQIKSEQKTIENAYKALVELAQDYQNNQILSIKRPLMTLFQSFGSIDFSKIKNKPLTGYDLSRWISKIKKYTDENILPDHLHDQFQKVLTLLFQLEHQKICKS